MKSIVDVEKDAQKEHGRVLYIPNSDLMEEYSQRVINYLKKKKIPIQIKRREGDFIPSLITRSEAYKGFEDIRRYSETLLEVREEHGFDKEPLGGKLLDSNRTMHLIMSLSNAPIPV